MIKACERKTNRMENGGMNSIKKYGIFLVCLFVFGSTSSVDAAARSGLLLAEPSIGVGLWTKQANISISSDADFVLKDADSQKILQRYKAGVKVFVSEKNKKLTINGKEIKSLHFFVEPEKSSDAVSLELNRKSYRGALEVIYRSGVGITVVNRLPLEAYLYSIVPGEMPASWHMEAVKAQAVAARSFALNSAGKHKTEGFNVCATTHCQVYNGKKAELERSTKAVDDTRGLILTYDNQPITAVFHSSSGGYTENSEDVWGSYCPYLRSVKDYDEGMPNYTWEKKMKPQEMQEKLETYGYSLGKLQAIELSVLLKEGKNAVDRTARGRVKTMRFIGDKGNIAVDGNKVRSMFGLNSTLFDLTLIVPADKKIEVPIGMYYKKDIDVKLPPFQEKGLMTDKAEIRRIHWRNDEEIVIKGYGWGHGLGMSQWGAKVMASKAPEKQDTYFKEILQHYYQNTAFKKVY